MKVPSASDWWRIDKADAAHLQTLPRWARVDGALKPIWRPKHRYRWGTSRLVEVIERRLTLFPDGVELLCGPYDPAPEDLTPWEPGLSAWENRAEWKQAATEAAAAPLVDAGPLEISRNQPLETARLFRAHTRHT